MTCQEFQMNFSYLPFELTCYSVHFSPVVICSNFQTPHEFLEAYLKLSSQRWGDLGSTNLRENYSDDILNESDVDLGILPSNLNYLLTF